VGGNGEMIGLKGDMVHFKEIQTSIYKVTIWHVIDGNIQ
jgi:hypothetical protein